ncbi:MAG: MBL fold metallo-hydrolase [Oscillospiraceae bacterium]|jgi:phosphoribosyl 1,2-cyclic phosphodiesterase|nr:MBL fold metallo-hydrolase [Oscillospiraceae bacterium]
MRICTLSSGSAGNAALIWQGGTYILVDIGISLKRVRENLQDIGFDIRRLSAILITHEHGDHVNGLPMFAKHHPDIPVYASGGTARELVRSRRCQESDVHIFQSGAKFALGDIEIQSFETPHDVAESVGFSFTDGKRKLGFATDLGHITPAVSRALCGSDTVLLECNHDLDMLKAGPYPYLLKQRILGHYGHLSNPDSADFAAWLGQNGTTRFVLAHLSEENNRPECAKAAVVESLTKNGLGTIPVEIAPPRICGSIFEV